MDNLSYAASDKEMTVFRNKDGTTVWTKPFKELSPNLRKIDELIPFWESETRLPLRPQRWARPDRLHRPEDTAPHCGPRTSTRSSTDDNVIYIKEKDAFAISTKDAPLLRQGAHRRGDVEPRNAFTGAVGKYVIDGDDMTCVNFVGPGLAALFSGFKNQIARIDLKTGNIKWEKTYVGRAERKVVTRRFRLRPQAGGGQGVPAC